MSACTIALTNDLSSSTLVRSAMRPQRFRATLADLHLPQQPGELLGQRALGVAGHLLHGGVEAEAGLHADRHQVDGVGQVALHLVGAVVAALVEVEVGHEEAEHQPDEQGQDRGWSPARRRAAARARPTRARATAPITLPDSTRSTRPAARVAGEVELVADPLGGSRRRRAVAQRERPLLQRLQDPLAERPVELAWSSRRARCSSPRAPRSSG